MRSLRGFEVSNFGGCIVGYKGVGSENRKAEYTVRAREKVGRVAGHRGAREEDGERVF